MRLTITTDEGTVIEIIDDVQLYDLDKPLAAAHLIGEIASAITEGRGQDAQERRDKIVNEVLRRTRGDY